MLDQARELFNKAEKTTNPALKKTHCERALEIIDEIMEKTPTEQQRIIIANIKKSFARSLVSQIEKMNINDIETTKFFYFNFVLKFPDEINELMKENYEFDKRIKWLAEQFRSDLV